jgi:polyhydroxyalkanoate synthesis repressor PhaR
LQHCLSSHRRAAFDAVICFSGAFILVTSKKTSSHQAKEEAQNSTHPSGSAPDPVRVIKKYPNRRLYDTQSSAYITLAEVKQLVIEGKPFAVRDAKTSEDLTRSILLQIILEEESGGVPMFSEAALANMIRFYGHTMQGFMGSMLEKNMQAFTDLQSKFGAGALPTLGSVPNASQFMGSFMEQSQAMAAQMQEQMLNAFGMKR